MKSHSNPSRVPRPKQLPKGDSAPAPSPEELYAVFSQGVEGRRSLRDWGTLSETEQFRWAAVSESLE